MTTETTGRGGEHAAGGEGDGPTVLGGSSRQFDPKLLEILVCPVTKSTLEYDAAAQELVSRAASLAYPIRDGIALLVREEARELK